MVRVFYHVDTLCVRGCRAGNYVHEARGQWVFAVHARVPETVPRWATRCSGSA